MVKNRYITLGRPPTEEELRESKKFWAKMERQWKWEAFWRSFQRRSRSDPNSYDTLGPDFGGDMG